jgi:hypothetical protein
MKRSILFFGVIIAFLTACTEVNPPANCGTVKFSWKANGTYYEGSSNYHFNPGVSGLHTHGFTACTNGNAPDLTLRLHDPIQVGTYTMMDVNDADNPLQGYAAYLDGTGSSYYDTDSTHTGSVIITALGTDTAMTGTFSFNTLHSTSASTINITEGVFTAIPQ